MKKMTDSADKAFTREIEIYKEFIQRRSKFYSDMDDSSTITENHIQRAVEEFNNTFSTNRTVIERKRFSVTYKLLLSLLLTLSSASLTLLIYSVVNPNYVGIKLFSLDSFDFDSLQLFLLCFVFMTVWCFAIIKLLKYRKKKMSNNEKCLFEFLNKWDELEYLLKSLYKKQYHNDPKNIKELLMFFDNLPGIHTQKGMGKKLFSLLETRNSIIHKEVRINDIKRIESSINEINTIISMLNAVSCLNRGIDYWEKGDYNKALSEYDKALEMNSDIAEAYYLRGKVYKDISEFDKANADFDKAIKMNPDFSNKYLEEIKEVKEKLDNGIMKKGS